MMSVMSKAALPLLVVTSLLAAAPPTVMAVRPSIKGPGQSAACWGGWQGVALAPSKVRAGPPVAVPWAPLPAG